MSIISFMAHKVTTSRATATSTDAYGNTSVTATSHPLSAHPCRFVVESRSLLASEVALAGYVIEAKLLLPAGSDIQDGDTIDSINLGEDGTVSGPFEVLEPRPVRKNGPAAFIEARLRRVS